MSLKLDLCAAILLISYELPAEAHDIYSPLKDRLGNSCCDDGDCRPAPYRVTPTGVQMLVNGDWIAVPNDTIQYRAIPGDTGETGGGHWCGRSHNWAATGWTMQPTAQSYRLIPLRSPIPPVLIMKAASSLFHKRASAKFRVQSPWLLIFCGSVSHGLEQPHQGRCMVTVGTGWLSPWVPQAAPITCPLGPRTRRGSG